MEHQRQLITDGPAAENASRALVMLHGRGATAQDILSLGSELSLNGYHIVAPQATNFTWYPYSFLAPVSQNEPWLSSALHLVRSVVQEIESAGIPTKSIYLLGFSQGACLTLEFVARNAQRWGGVIAFTGGLIGEQINTSNYIGNFEDTPFFIGNSDRDPHVPLTRSDESARIIQSMGGKVLHTVYPGMGHTINSDELANARLMLK